MKKLTFLSIFLFFLSFNVFAQKTISTKAQNYIDSFMNLRMELTRFKDGKDANKELNKYKNENTYSDFSEEEKLIIDSFYLLEKYNYIWEDKSNDDILQKELLALAEKNEKFMKNHKDNINDWLYVVTADLYSCYMSYSPFSSGLKYGMTVKDYYLECLKINPKNSYCLTHMGQWYYWAPGINGGSEKKALQSFLDAVTYARNNAEKFYAYMFLSQMYYEKKDKTNASANLAKAKSYYKESQLISELEYYNSIGYSLFTYSKKKSEDQNRSK